MNRIKEWIIERAPELLVVAMLITIGLILLALHGCASVRKEQSTTDTVHHEVSNFSGSFKLPLPTTAGIQVVDVPVVFKIVRDGYDTAKSEAQSRSQLDLSELSNALIGTIKQAFPIAGAFMGPAPAKDWTAEILTGSGLLGTVAAAVLKSRADAARMRDKDAEIEHHKADAEEGWAKATEYKDSTRDTDRPDRA